MALASEVEATLAGPDYADFLRNMYGNSPAAWDEGLSGYERLRVIVNAMTRLRLCDENGRMEFSHKTDLTGTPPGFMPWFEVPGRAHAGTPIVWGHWAALGLVLRSDVLGIDTGCVWGRELSALRLEDRRLFQCGCRELRGTASEE